MKWIYVGIILMTLSSAYAHTDYSPAENWKEIEETKVPELREKGIVDFSLSSKGKYLSVFYENKSERWLEVFEIQKSIIKKLASYRNIGNCASVSRGQFRKFSSDGLLFSYGGFRKCPLYVLDLLSGAILNTKIRNIGTDFALTHRQDGTIIIVYRHKNKGKIFLSSSKQTRKLPFPNRVGKLMFLNMDSRGLFVVAGFDQGILLIWDADSLAILLQVPIKGLTDSVTISPEKVVAALSYNIYPFDVKKRCTEQIEGGGTKVNYHKKECQQICCQMHLISATTRQMTKQSIAGIPFPRSDIAFLYPRSLLVAESSESGQQIRLVSWNKKLKVESDYPLFKNNSQDSVLMIRAASLARLIAVFDGERILVFKEGNVNESTDKKDETDLMQNQQGGRRWQN